MRTGVVLNDQNFRIHSGGVLFLGTSLAESLSIFHDLAMGETAATGAKHRWNAEGAGMPPLPNHRKNKGRRHQSEENKATPEYIRTDFRCSGINLLSFLIREPAFFCQANMIKMYFYNLVNLLF
jgi:hypothetical protein